MNTGTFLHYVPGKSRRHRHDARFKLLEMAVWTILAMSGTPLGLGVILVQLTCIHAVSGTRLRSMRKPLQFWLFMALAIVVTAGFSDPLRAEAPLVIAERVLPLGRAGILNGVLKALRLLAVLSAGQLLAATTDPAELAGAVRRLTGFLPRSWSGSLATAISLTISFIPRLLDEAATIRDAAFSRGLGLRRSIFRRALSLGLPMAEAALRRANLTTEALLSRCCTDNPTPPDMRLTSSDWLILASSVFPPFLGMFIPL